VAARLARDIEPSTPGRPLASEPAHDPYMSAVEPEAAGVSTGAQTMPRVEHFPPPEHRRGFRKRESAAAGAPDATYLRWPHSQG
jgi:hypothetical protein